MKLLYGTGNLAKLSAMRNRLEQLDIELIGLNDLRVEGKNVPEVKEDGNTPLENARLKAMVYYEAFQIPVFSCDSGLYFDNVPDEVQPGVHVRNVNGKCLSDDEMIDYYSGLVKAYGNLVARYRNAICFVMDNTHIYEAKYLQIERQYYSQIQLAAKQTIEYIKNIIKPGMNLLEIRKLCEGKLLELGADSFWYWDVGAFVFAGDETTVSVSGKQYVTSDRVIGNNDIITIDLSPQVGNIWGDYARTIIVENGMVVENIGLIENPEWKSGLQMEEKLHAELLRFATKETTFEKLYYHMNEFIVENGFVNLDFMGNLGHSIVKTKGDRVYIEKGNMTKLGDVKYFTFEPHIGFPNSKYGYKKENIYYFDENGLMEL